MYHNFNSDYLWTGRNMDYFLIFLGFLFEFLKIVFYYFYNKIANFYIKLFYVLRKQI